MNLNLSEEQQFIQQTARDFAEKKLVGNAAKLDAGQAKTNF